MAKHTPTPWYSEADVGLIGHYTIWANVDRVKTFVADCHEGPEDAAFIVRAVNCHDDLVAALKAVCGIGEEYSGLKWSDREKMVTDALAKATAP